MRTIRIVLQIIIGLLCLTLLFNFSTSASADYNSDLAMLVFFIFLLLILGPWWPSQENTERWLDKFQLPTDNIDVSKYIASFLLAAYGFYHAWDVYANPTKELWRYDKKVYNIAGIDGVIVFWLVLSSSLMVSGIKFYVKSRAANKSV